MINPDLGKTKIARLVAPTDRAPVIKFQKEAIQGEKTCSADKCEICGADITHETVDEHSAGCGECMECNRGRQFEVAYRCFRDGVLRK